MFLLYSLREFFFTVFTKYKQPLSIDTDFPARNDISILKKSLSIRVVDAGDDEGTMAELYALESPEYSTERIGMHIVASPKHADAIMIVGAITDNMRQAVLDTYDVIPGPKIVIACGDKAIYGDSRFYATTIATKDILPVDIVIPGNPPRAIDILSYIDKYMRSAV